MAERSKKISELTALAANTVANTDLLVIVDVSATETKKITASDFAGYLAKALVIPGPYTDDTAAAADGISVGSPYYKSDGVVYVRLT